MSSPTRPDAELSDVSATPAAESGDAQSQLRELIHLAQSGYATMLEHMIADGVDVNMQDAYGMTALHHAAAKGARECVRALVACGRCDYLMRDHDGRYAFELALEWGRDHAIAELLEKKQAEQAFARGVPAYIPRSSST